ncbi:type II toxin-antitoxin system ParD family antitoxin, partial [Mycobacterium tuberculosis]|nr:type II toxin-antitoxin system ParD family antitoxin [Mycobacterium tuberculosis]
VVLGERYDTFIAQLIQDGRYASASQVLGEGLRLVEERERKFDVVRQAAERGDADAQAFIDELR